MPLQFSDNRLFLSGVVTIEEAEALCQLLCEHPDTVVDLGECTHLHAAVLQVLLAARPERIAPPGDEFLERFVLPALRAAAGWPAAAGTPSETVQGDRQ